MPQLCGDWAGKSSVLSTTGCSALSGTSTCYTTYVLDSSNYANAYVSATSGEKEGQCSALICELQFEIQYIKTYSSSNSSSSSSTSSSSSGLAAVSGVGPLGTAVVAVASLVAVLVGMAF